MSSILFFFSGIVLYGIILNLREVSLNEAMIRNNLELISNPSIVIDRKKYTLDLYSDNIKVKSYVAVFGRNGSSLKTSKSDFITPRGSYKICLIDTNNIYYKKLLLNYPNVQDASEALRMKIITKDEFLDISKNCGLNQNPYSKTTLGANIGIQGTGKYNLIFKNLPFVFNWTNGSIAVSNENIDELLSVVHIGTKVTIKN